MGRSANVHLPLSYALNELKTCCKPNYVMPIRTVQRDIPVKCTLCNSHVSNLVKIKTKIEKHTCLYDVAQSKFVLYVLQFVFGVAKWRLQ